MAQAQTPEDHLEATPPPLLRGRWWPADGNTTLFNPGKMRTIRYRYRGTKIPTPWTATT